MERYCADRDEACNPSPERAPMIALAVVAQRKGSTDWGGNMKRLRFQLSLVALLIGALVVASPGSGAPPARDGNIAFASSRTCPNPTTGPCADYLEIYVMDAATGSVTRLTNNSISDTEPALSPDGNRIAFFSTLGDTEILLLNIDGSGGTQLTDNAADDWDPSWSPDGRQIIFVSNRDGNPELYIMNADGTGQTRLTFDSRFDEAPAMSPDGSTIAWARSGEIVVMPTLGGPTTQLTDTPGLSDSDPDWSPDGERLVFACQDPLPVNICGIDRDGRHFRSLTSVPSNERALDPVWSPDGKTIAFASGPDGGEVISFSRTAGKAKIELSSELGRFPSWRRMVQGTG